MLGICYHGIGVCNQVTQGIQESLVLHHLGIDVVQLGHADSCSFPHIGVLILQTLAERLAQVLRDFIHADAAHGAHGQGTDQRVWVLTVLHQNTNKSAPAATDSLQPEPGSISLITR